MLPIALRLVRAATAVVAIAAMVTEIKSLAVGNRRALAGRALLQSRAWSR